MNVNLRLGELKKRDTNVLRREGKRKIRELLIRNKKRQRAEKREKLQIGPESYRAKTTKKVRGTSTWSQPTNFARESNYASRIKTIKS